MLLPVDPILRVRLAGVRLTARISSVAVLAITTAGVNARLDGGRLGQGTAGDWIAAGLVVSGALIVVLLAHEAAHVWACRRLGVGVRRIHFYLFGGAPEIIDDTSNPRAETLIALTGLAALAGMGVVLAAVAVGTRHATAAIHVPLQALGIAMIGLLILQTMPGLPLDGGRLFRAFVWHLTDDPMAGTRAAAIYAQFIGIGLVMLGIILVALDQALPFWGLLIAAAGWHLSAAARTGIHNATWQRFSRTQTLADVAPRASQTIPADATIDTAVDLLVDAGQDSPIVVTASAGQPIGVIRLANLRGTRRAAWNQRPVTDVMTPLNDLPRLSSNVTIFDAVDLLDDHDHQIILVEDNSAPIAAITRNHLITRMFSRQAPGNRR